MVISNPKTSALFVCLGLVFAISSIHESRASQSCRYCHTLASKSSSLCYGGDICGFLGDGTHQDCATCLSYVKCTGGTRENVACPSGRVWNQANQQCDWPWVTGLTCEMTSSDFDAVSTYLRESGDWQLGGLAGMMYMQDLSLNLMSDSVSAATSCPNCMTGKLKEASGADVISPGEGCGDRIGDYQMCDSCLKMAICQMYPFPIQYPCGAGMVYDPQAPGSAGNPLTKCLEPWKTNACSLTAQDQAAICSHYQGAAPGSEAAYYYSTHC